MEEETLWPHRQRAAVAAWPLEPVAYGNVVADALVSIVPPNPRGHEEPPSDGIVAERFGGRVLRLAFVDGAPCHWDGLPGPDEGTVRAVVEFARRVEAEAPGARIAVHCTAGVSRSCAAALAVLADRLGPGREEEAVGLLLDGFRDGLAMFGPPARQQMAPNPLMVALAGRVTGCGRRLHDALLERCEGYADWCGVWASRMGGRDRLEDLIDGAAGPEPAAPAL